MDKKVKKVEETINEQSKPQKEIFKINNVIQTKKEDTFDKILERNKSLSNNNDTLKQKCETLEKKIIEQKEHIEQLYKNNMKYKVDYKEYDNFKLSMSCIDILNKGLLFFLTIYMLTTTSHSYTKIIYQGFSFFDWIVLFLCIIQLTCKTPILYMKS
jgi:predicted RNase H-like nuclease (RuvC/YqgF family)